MSGADELSGVHDALDRMRRAHERGTGCHLTAEMIGALGCTFLAQTWSEERPATLPTDKEKP